MTSSIAKAMVWIAACGAVACSGDDGELAGQGGSSSSAPSTTGQGGQGGGFSSGSGAGGENGSSGCTKVDFLFIVDNSVSMQDQQQALITSFPGFIAAIQQNVDANSDYHMLVTDTDAWGRCNTANPWTGVDPSSATCNAYIESTVFDECDRTRGGAVVHPAGQHASNQTCGIQGGYRYIVEGQPDLADTFACMAQVGVAGHPSERPMDAMVAALSPNLNAAGACNEGFLRNDAILVITFISDDPNYEDSGTPQEWYDAVVAAKGGNTDAVVVLGLTPNFDGCGSGGPPKGAHWSEFIALWGSRGIEANICDSDYAPFFQQAVGIIDETCDDFEPVE